MAHQPKNSAALAMKGRAPARRTVPSRIAAKVVLIVGRAVLIAGLIVHRAAVTLGRAATAAGLHAHRIAAPAAKADSQRALRSRKSPSRAAVHQHGNARSLRRANTGAAQGCVVLRGY